MELSYNIDPAQNSETEISNSDFIKASFKFRGKVVSLVKMQELSPLQMSSCIKLKLLLLKVVINS